MRRSSNIESTITTSTITTNTTTNTNTTTLHTQKSEPLIVVNVDEDDPPQAATTKKTRHQSSTSEQTATDTSPHSSSEDEEDGDGCAGAGVGYPRGGLFGGANIPPPNDSLNPYLLSPFGRDVRKHSLPTPQCSGITASQVRRLSERGGADAQGPGPRQTEFLATLSQAPTPAGRRHSVVTISKVPLALFGTHSSGCGVGGRNRRESTCGAFFPTRVLPGRCSRRESVTGGGAVSQTAGPPSTEPRGSVHNLQLDIMDDIVQARKVRMRLWNTSSERVCEVQPLNDDEDEDGVDKDSGGTTINAGGGSKEPPERYVSSKCVNSSGGVGGGVCRRFSDFVGTTLTPIPSMAAGSSSRRRASELPPILNTAEGYSTSTSPQSSSSSSSTSAPGPNNTSGASKLKQNVTGIVCTNNDLVSILSRSTPTNQKSQQQVVLHNDLSGGGGVVAELALSGKNNKQPQQQTELLNNPNQLHLAKEGSGIGGAIKKRSKSVHVSKSYTVDSSGVSDGGSGGGGGGGRVVWDGRSGSMVDAHALGSAIEVFLRRSGEGQSSTSISKGGIDSPKKLLPQHSTDGPNNNNSIVVVDNKCCKSKGWFDDDSNKSSNNRRDEDNNRGGGGGDESCNSSICSTLKDLFV